jgi:signal transduction histidine kinase
MVSRPAFLARFLSRFPDLRSLRSRGVGWTVFVAGSFGLLLALAAIQLDARRCEEVARVRAVTLAQTAGLWLDGDAHSGLGGEPEKRLADVTASLKKLLDLGDYPGSMRTLRPRADAKAALASRPEAGRAAALEIVIATGEGAGKKDVDYRPAMAGALFEGVAASELSSGQIWAYAPVFDSWGSTPALVWVAGPATAPLWRRLAFGAGALLFSGLLVSFTVWKARRSAERLELHFATLDSLVRELASGRVPAASAPVRRAPSELASLAGSLETLRARLQAQATGQPLPPPPATDAEEERAAELGEPADFDLALLLQQLVEPARKMAQTRRVELQLVFPDGTPSHLRGHPVPLFRALDSLLRNALRATAQGRITLRVSRAGEGSEGDKLRFEVSDTSPGIAFKEQQDLAAALAGAASADPSTLKDSLQLASALARALGGELSFVSQPGQGSRFGFTASFQKSSVAPAAGVQPLTATAFLPYQSTAFQTQAGTAFQPRPGAPGQMPPESAFVPRSKVQTR